MGPPGRVARQLATSSNQGSKTHDGSHSPGYASAIRFKGSAGESGREACCWTQHHRPGPASRKSSSNVLLEVSRERVLQSPMFTCQDVGITAEQVRQAFQPGREELTESDIVRAGLAGLEPPEFEPLVEIRPRRRVEAVDGTETAVIPEPVEAGSPEMPFFDALAAWRGQLVVPPELRQATNVRAAMADNRQRHVTINGFTPEVVLVDSGSEPVILGKRMVQLLCEQGIQVQSSDWQIRTAGGGVEPLHGETVLPLNIDLRPGTADATGVRVRCLLTEATTYDVILGMEALFPPGFLIDLGTENAFYRPDWSNPTRLACIPLDLHGMQSPRHAHLAQSNFQVVCEHRVAPAAYHVACVQLEEMEDDECDAAKPGIAKPGLPAMTAEVAMAPARPELKPATVTALRQLMDAAVPGNVRAASCRSLMEATLDWHLHDRTLRRAGSRVGDSAASRFGSAAACLRGRRPSGTESSGRTIATAASSVPTAAACRSLSRCFHGVATGHSVDSRCACSEFGHGRFSDCRVGVSRALHGRSWRRIAARPQRPVCRSYACVATHPANLSHLRLCVGELSSPTGCEVERDFSRIQHLLGGRCWWMPSNAILMRIACAIIGRTWLPHLL